MPPALSLMDVLPDFGSPAPSAAAQRATANHFDPLLRAPEPPTEEPAPSVQTQADEMVVAAETALAERLAHEHTQQLEQERQRHREELEAVRAQFGEATGETIKTRFCELEQQVVDLTTQATARMLATTLTDDLQKRSVAELERVVRAAIDDRDAVRIRVSGSPALWESLKAGLGEKASHVDFTETPGFDISIAVDEELFETRLTEWSATLAELIS
ncbi:hypothetical protein [uncultured Nitratireductor sp.]|uniref:hypothetical protein n=1 Tax=uncultured Nitratireductor sp. TaxID=520953 RepID=UPI0025EB5CE3|nr:hypothetical protein [uncultured Nitratireductor sp.]